MPPCREGLSDTLSAGTWAPGSGEAPSPQLLKVPHCLHKQCIYAAGPRSQPVVGPPSDPFMEENGVVGCPGKASPPEGLPTEKAKRPPSQELTCSPSPWRRDITSSPEADPGLAHHFCL